MTPDLTALLTPDPDPAELQLLNAALAIIYPSLRGEPPPLTNPWPRGSNRVGLVALRLARLPLDQLPALLAEARFETLASIEHARAKSERERKHNLGQEAMGRAANTAKLLAALTASVTATEPPQEKAAPDE